MWMIYAVSVSCKRINKTRLYRPAAGDPGAWPRLEPCHSVKMFWSNTPKWVESQATAVEPVPQMAWCRTAKVALAISAAMARALSGDRYRRRT